jgi:hypothetical protein
VDGVGDEAPAANLFVGVHAGGENIAQALLRNLCRLADDQPGARALAVIFRHQFIGDLAATNGAVAGQRRHDDAVVQRQVAQDEGLEQFGFGRRTDIEHGLHPSERLGGRRPAQSRRGAGGRQCACDS